jgi:uncharacterized membrane protein
MSEVTAFSLLFAGVGLLFVGLAIPLILGKVPPNPYYGCRTRRTLSDPRIWYEANRTSGKDFLVSGVLVFAASIGMLLFAQKSNPTHVVFALVAVLLVSIGIAAWHCIQAIWD